MQPKEQIKLAEVALDNPENLEKVAFWIRNGSTGVLHADPHCWKYKAGKTSQAPRLSVIEAGQKRACPNCFDRNISIWVANTREYHNYLEMASEINRARSLMSYRKDSGNVARALVELRGNIQNLERILQDPKKYEGFYQGASKSLEDAKSLLVEAQTRISGSTSEITHKLVMSLMAPTYTDPKELATKSEMNVLDSSSAYIIQGLFDDWSESHLKDESLELREQAYLKKAERTIRFKNLKQLEGVPLENVSGDAGLEVAVAWTKEKNAILTRMLARWEAQADDLMSFTKTSIVGVKTGIYSNDRSMLLEQVIDGFKVKVNLEHKTAILRVPEVVKIWLETASPASFRSYGVKTLQVTVTDTSDEVLETAVALWDPQGEAPYNNLENCLKAGEALK